MNRANINRRDFLKSLTALGVAGYAQPQFALDAADGSLKQLAAGKGFLFGSCLALKYCVQSPAYQQLFLAQCDVATPELHMKWNALSREPGVYDFAAADQFVGFCAANRIEVRGHTLIWHDALPSWAAQQLAAYAGRPDGDPRGQAMMTAHIRTMASHFAGKLYSWDVVNEVLDPSAQRPDGLRQSAWLEACGPGYVELAFRSAAVADPHAQLIWNENYLEVSNGFGWAKRKAMLALLDEWKSRGVPIHGIGIEAHLRADQIKVLGDATYEAFLAELASRGMKIFITELDVQDSTLPADPAARDQAVAEVYDKFLGASLRQPAVRGIVTWGLADRFTWIAGYRPRKDGLPVRPLPFDESCRPKPAYYAIARAFQGAPARQSPSRFIKGADRIPG